MSETTDADKPPSLWRVVTFCPLDIPFGLRLGYSHDADDVSEFIATLDKKTEIIVKQKNANAGTGIFVNADYLNTADDVSSLRLFAWCYEHKSAKVIFHVFPMHIAICELGFEVSASDAEQLDRVSLKLAEHLFKDAQQGFHQFLEKIASTVPSEAFEFNYTQQKPAVYWPSRMILSTHTQISTEQNAQLIQDWLKDTIRPDDYLSLLNKKTKQSMTWLKYVVLDHKGSEDVRIDSMILAQYCYTAQEKSNKALRKAIEWAFSTDGKQAERELQKAKGELAASRLKAKMHEVSVNEALRHLTRRKRRFLDEILKDWEYERLVENGRAMLELCSDKIQESNSRQAKISASKTEYILMGISLFTVLEFFFFVTQFSREAMANPTLDHKDGGPSTLLTFIARIPADLMFFIGIFLAFMIFLIYKKVRG